MPSSQTEIDVINKALTLLGDTGVISRTENNERARTMNLIYDSARDRVLRECPWNFALKRVTLLADPTAPLWGFSSRYAIPSDFLYMVQIEDQEGGLTYSLEENFINADPSDGLVGGSLSILYVKRITDMSFADSLFVEALMYRLAYEGCERITQSNTKKEELLREYEKTSTRAKRLNGQEDSPKEFTVDTWLQARDHTTLRDRLI